MIARRLLASRRDSNFQLLLLIRFQSDQIRGTPDIQSGRLRIEDYAGETLHAVKPTVGKPDAAGCHLGVAIVTPPRAPEASNLEQISEIKAEQEIQGYLHGHARKVSNDHF